MGLAARTINSNKNASISQSFEWCLPPNQIFIKSGEVHIWKADLNVVATYQVEARILSADEKDRADRMIDPLKRGRFRSARIALREILSLYKNESPEMIEFSFGKNGKPYIKQGSLKYAISFNISHSADLMLVVLSNSAPVGIDLEEKHSLTSQEWIIRQYFSQKDNYFLNQLPEGERLSAFLRLWTLKEAYAKALGSGLAAAPELDFSERNYHSDLCLNQVIISPKDDFWFLCFLPQKGFIASSAILTNIYPVPRFYAYASKSGN
jgi:phosphopantetheinyl transferase